MTEKQYYTKRNENQNKSDSLIEILKKKNIYIFCIYPNSTAWNLHRYDINK